MESLRGDALIMAASATALLPPLRLSLLRVTEAVVPAKAGLAKELVRRLPALAAAAALRRRITCRGEGPREGMAL